MPLPVAALCVVRGMDFRAKTEAQRNTIIANAPASLTYNIKLVAEVWTAFSAPVRSCVRPGV